MKKITLFFFLLAAGGPALQAQTTEDSIKNTINDLFKGMLNVDKSLVRSSFGDSAILQTIARNFEGKMVIENQTVEGFIAVISRLEKGAADEKVSFDVIRVDGPLAMVWATYEFFYNGKFSHCGVDSFQLVRINGQWKIQYLIDTRRRTGCKK